MLDLSANDHARRFSTTIAGPPYQADEGKQLSNISEIAQYKSSNGNIAHATSASEPSAAAIVSSGGCSRGPSLGSGVGQIHTEKTRGPSPRRVLHRPSTARSQGRKSTSKDDAAETMQNGTRHISMADSAKLPNSPKRKKSGLGTVIRKIFGRRSVKNRISLPAPVEHREHVSYTRDDLNRRLTAFRTHITLLPHLQTSNHNVQRQRRRLQQKFYVRVLLAHIRHLS